MKTVFVPGLLLLTIFSQTLAAEVTITKKSNQCYTTYTKCLNETGTQGNQAQETVKIVEDNNVDVVEVDDESNGADVIKIIKNDGDREESFIHNNKLLEQQLQAMLSMMTMIQKLNTTVSRLTEQLEKMPDIIIQKMNTQGSISSGSASSGSASSGSASTAQGTNKTDCPTNFFLVTGHGCYHVAPLTELRTKSGAEIYCQNLNAKLAALETQEEYVAVLAKTENLGYTYDKGYASGWLGAKRTSVEQDTYQWNSGQSITLPHDGNGNGWAAAHPPGKGVYPDRHCVKWGHTGFYNGIFEVVCDANYPAVCEM